MRLKKLLNKGSITFRDVLTSLNIQAKIILSIIFGISLLVTFFAFLIISNIQSNIDNQVVKLNHNLKISQNLSYKSGEALSKYYVSNEARNNKLKSIAEDFFKDHAEIAYVVFTDNSGNIYYKSQFANLYDLSTLNENIPPPKTLPHIKIIYSKSGKVLNITEPISYNSTLYGWAWVGIPDTGFTIVGSKNELIVFLFQIFLLVWIVSIIGAIVNSLIIMQPLKRLEHAAKAISEGRFGFQLPLKGFLGKELTLLIVSFNRMSKRLKQYEESNLATLSSEKNKFESVVMSIADGVIVFDKENTVQIINPAAAKLLDRSSDELIGQKITSIWETKTNNQINDYLSKSKTGHDYFYEYANFEVVRDNLNLKLIITPLYNNINEQLGAVMVIQDRTKEAEIELIKQEFISNVSHELRTPITSIKCYVDTLCSHEDNIDEFTRKEFLSTINQETDRLSNLVNDVLELSRLESPTRKLELSVQEIYSPIDFAIKAVQVLANKKRISFTQDIEKNLPLLNINQENIERILINLLSNAIKYTPGNGMIKLIVRRSDNEIFFDIIDNGIGIDEEHLPLVFERFYRVENKVHTIKGTGLGLTIVKKSVEQHGGKLSVRSKLGEGSIFQFSIPIPLEQLKEDKNNSITASV